MARREIIAMILAGGQGSRLGVLTKKIAKPAVMYGGKYRIIDFTLSNCVNSGIETVGILTQYQPLKLNSHIGIGKPWDLDRMHGGVTILSPYIKDEKGEWYKGTANAIFQNIDYIDKLGPEYILILSGDHVYKMDYSKMLDFHKQNNAEATISVINVPIEEADRYGIMSIDDRGKIYKFEEKPKNPQSTLASMGVYIYTWEVLKNYLIKDNIDEQSEHDFGKNIIPNMLKDGRSLWAYEFSGYWKDVGTIQAYWESNMELVKRLPEFNLYEQTWKIYSFNPIMPPHYVDSKGSVNTSVVAEGCMIYGTVKNSVIFPGVVIEEGALIEDSIVMSKSRVGKGAYINHSIIGEGVCVGSNVRIGVGEPVPNEYKPGVYNSGITVVGDNACIPGNVVMGKNVMVDIGVGPEDFCSLDVPSGKSVFKGGDCE
ncbi:MAG TPA: glucose-1-phosphate adenylyltransferase [Clostridiales bacterium]|nr:glucose-1-phosphate adenylyltransferase [Clostridiales bacterium]